MSCRCLHIAATRHTFPTRSLAIFLGLALASGGSVSDEPRGLWQVHLRIPESGPVAVAVMRGEERVTDGVLRSETPSDALRMLEQLLQPFRIGEQLFITARTDGAQLSMWRTQSKATALYWCASALAKLWRMPEELAHTGRAQPSF
jgi:hypothetical protein